MEKQRREQRRLPEEFKKTKGISLEGMRKLPKASKVESAEQKTNVADDRSTDTGVDNDLKTLRAFDLDTRYGPCIGISRLSRWERAKNLELNPPKNIPHILSQHQKDDPVYSQCLWNNEKGLVS